MIFIIPIKKNSKRLKNKNFLMLKKKPLFKWTTDFAKKFFKKENILITTDCKKTANLLKQNGFQVPFLRPKYLSKQSSSMFSVIYHAINIFSFCEISSAKISLMTAAFRHLRLSVPKEFLYRLK